MKHKVKWTGLLTAIICLVPLLTGVFGLSENAKAAGETVSVTLHKKKMDEFPNTAIANTGKEMNEFDHYQGLPGVTFTAWDVTEDFYSKLGLTGSETDAVAKTKTEALMQTFVLDKGNATNVASDVTDANGNVTFPTLEKRTAGGIYKVYYFEETLPAGYTTYSNPIILVLPAMDGANELSTIHLYPKNKIDDKEKPEKILVDEAGKALEGVPAGETFYTFEVGKRINYKASFTFPSQIGEILTEAGVEQTRYNKLIDEQVVGKIGRGFMILLGIHEEDTQEDADYLIRKIPLLRVFEDAGGKMNQSLQDVGGSVLSVSQFTLYADTKKGNRPSYVKAARPETAIPLYEYFNEGLRKAGLVVETGEFGGDMDVALINDGPVTILFDTRDK